MSSYKDLKEIAWECNMQLPRLGLVLHTFGNASVIDRARGVVAIKPSGLPYAELVAEDMVIVDLQNNPVEGKYRPSSDTKTHTLLYRSFASIGGVVHTHSPYAVAWAQARRPVPILGTTHADHLPCDIPCTGEMSDVMIAGDFEEETGKLILERFKGLSYRETPMVLVAGHGPFAWGETPERAVYNCSMLEELCRIATLTLEINPDAPRLKQTLIDKHYQRKHGPASYYGQENPDGNTGGKQ